MAGHIYFILAKECARIKIGWSSNVSSRLRALQTSSPVPLELLCSVPAAHTVEKAVHKKFKHLRVKDEWFAVETDLLGFVDSLLNGVYLMSLLSQEDLRGKRIDRARVIATDAGQDLRDYFASEFKGLQ